MQKQKKILPQTFNPKISLWNCTVLQYHYSTTTDHHHLESSAKVPCHYVQ